MNHSANSYQAHSSRKRRVFLFMSLFILFPSFSFGQSPTVNHWFMGNGIHLDFNGGALNVDTLSQLFCYEGTFTMSDDSGDMLFVSMGLPDTYIYSNVYDANLNIMPNGDSLFASSSAIQASISVKVPGSTNQYYLFNNSSQENQYLEGITYSIIDMSLNNGLGDVDVLNKNILLPQDPETSNSEAMTIARHCNGVDYWLITEKVICDDFPYDCYPNNSFQIYSITASGVAYESEYQGSGWCCGQMKFNPLGNKMYYGNILYDFDNETGQFSNPIDLNEAINTQTSLGMASFSQSGAKLYIKEVWGDLFQFDLTLQDFQNSPISILLNWPTAWSKPNGPMQLAPNGKIYLAWNDAQYVTPWKFLGVINEPESIGASCDIELDAIPVPGYSNQVLQSIPSFVESDLSIDGVVSGCTTSVSDLQENLLVIYPNPVIDIIHINGIDKHELVGISIVDNLGRLHFENIDKPSLGTNVSELKSGYYIVQLRLVSGQIITRSIIKY